MAHEYGFANTVQEFNQLTSVRPIAKASILASLENITQVGEQEAADRNSDLGSVRYADQTIQAHAAALALNAENAVQPPFSNDEITTIQIKIDDLGLLTQGNGATGAAGPTDIAQLSTTGRK